MDDQRFDRISRIIAASTSRRNALKGIAAAVGGGALVSVFGMRPQRAGAQGITPPGGECATGDDCTTGLCNEGNVCYCVDPAEPLRGCPCDTGTEAPCGGGTLLCCPTGSEPGGSGVCTPDSVGCDPTGECTSQPGESCQVNADCCEGSCSEQGVCYCEDPSRPQIGCSCDTGTENACGDNSLLCCATGSEPGSPGVCTSSSVGCNPTGECTAQPGEACSSDNDCCEGTCSEEGVCYCSDPARPWIGCSCNVGTEAPCGGGTAVCCPLSDEPGALGVCTSDSVGCNPLGECTADPGESCQVDADCCEGSCSEDGVCYCLDPAEPQRGCSCHTGTEHPCGSESLLCCADAGTPPGGTGICTPDRLGCDTVGACGGEGDACEYHEECCGDLICHHGACAESGGPIKPPHHGGGKTGGSETVTALPSTGSGAAAANSGGLLGAAALAGAAAIAARKLLPKPADTTSDGE